MLRKAHTDDMKVTPFQRFAAHDLLIDLGRNGAASSKTARAIRHAQQWEGFPDSYHEVQVEAAQDLILVISSPDDEAMSDAVEFVLELASIQQSELVAL